MDSTRPVNPLLPANAPRPVAGDETRRTPRREDNERSGRKRRPAPGSPHQHIDEYV